MSQRGGLRNHSSVHTLALTSARPLIVSLLSSFSSTAWQPYLGFKCKSLILHVFFFSIKCILLTCVDILTQLHLHKSSHSPFFPVSSVPLESIHFATHPSVLLLLVAA